MLGIGDILSLPKQVPVAYDEMEETILPLLLGNVATKVPISNLVLFGTMLPSTDPLSNKTWPTMFPKELWRNFTYLLSSCKEKRMTRNSQSDSILDSYVGKGSSRWRSFHKVTFNLSHNIHTHTEKSPASPFLSLLTYLYAPLHTCTNIALLSGALGFPLFIFSTDLEPKLNYSDTWFLISCLL